MSGRTYFTPHEKDEFRQWEHQRRRNDQVNFFRHGVPSSPRRGEGIYAQDAQREQQRAEAVAEPYTQNYTIDQADGRVYLYDRQYHDRYTSPDSFCGVCKETVYWEPTGSQPHHLDDGFSEHANWGIPAADGQAEAQPEDAPPPNPTVKIIRKVGDHLRYMRMHSERTGWQGLIATLDTGTAENWICREVADRLNLRIKATEPVRYITFDGRCFSSEETVEATWAVERQSKTHVNVFRVAPSEAPFDVLLGRELTFSNAVDFDSEVRSIRTCVEKPPTAEEKEQIERDKAAAKAERRKYNDKPQRVNKSQKESTSASTSSRQVPQGLIDSKKTGK